MPVRTQLDQRRALSSALDEMWSYVGKKAHPRWLWHAIDHYTGQVLASVFGRRKDEVFLRLKALLRAVWHHPVFHRRLGDLRAPSRRSATHRGEGTHAYIYSERRWRRPNS